MKDFYLVTFITDNWEEVQRRLSTPPFGKFTLSEIAVWKNRGLEDLVNKMENIEIVFHTNDKKHSSNNKESKS